MLFGKHRELTEAEHKAAQLRFDLGAAYTKLLFVIEDIASVQADILQHQNDHNPDAFQNNCVGFFFSLVKTINYAIVNSEVFLY